MGVLFKRYKTKFRYALKPFFVMIVAKRKELTLNEWLELVEQTKRSIKSNPQEFLGSDLPESALLMDILDEIFVEFHRERAYHDRVLLK